MPNPTRFSALAIEKDCRGETFIGEVRSARSEIAARCLAAAMAATRPGAVAFSHSGDLSSLEPADVVILNCYGNLENGMLRAQIATTGDVTNRRRLLGARRPRASGGGVSRWPYLAQVLRRHR
jgi:hypothetical protein